MLGRSEQCLVWVNVCSLLSTMSTLLDALWTIKLSSLTGGNRWYFQLCMCVLYTVLFYPFLWLFSWHWVISSYMCWLTLFNIWRDLQQIYRFSLYEAIFFPDTLLYSSNLGFLGLSTPSPQFWRSPGLFLSLLSLHYGSSCKIVYWGNHRTQLVCFPFLKGHSSLLFSILKYIVL